MNLRLMKDQEVIRLAQKDGFHDDRDLLNHCANAVHFSRLCHKIEESGANIYCGHIVMIIIKNFSRT